MARSNSWELFRVALNFLFSHAQLFRGFPSSIPVSADYSPALICTLPTTLRCLMVRSNTTLHSAQWTDLAHHTGHRRSSSIIPFMEWRWDKRYSGEILKSSQEARHVPIWDDFLHVDWLIYEINAKAYLLDTTLVGVAHYWTITSRVNCYSMAADERIIFVISTSLRIKAIG